MAKKPVLLVILDGFGYREETRFNAIAQAHTPHLDSWFAHYPHALLEASGKAVGLTEGSIGNSEVGHLTIGAGRIIEQPESFILHAIQDGSFFTNPVLQAQLTKLKKSGKALHIIGLLSDAGVHCREKIIHAFIQAAAQSGIENIFIHPILDGRDTPPHSAVTYLNRLDDFIDTIPQAKIGSLHGRFYAMDRDNNWDRTEKSYDVLAPQFFGSNGKNENQLNLKNTEIPHPRSSRRIERPGVETTWQQALEQNYISGITDEFIVPINLIPRAIINSDDGIIFANYRADRARQLTECFTQPSFDHFKRINIDLTFFLTPVSYGAHIHTQVMYPHKPAPHTLKEELSQAGKTIFSVAETEKYAHVTYFFSGGKESAFPGETQVLIPSIKVKDYVENPQMSAPEITQAVIQSLRTDPCDFYLINYANADMVGHSGNFEATKKSIEILDKELDKLFKVAVTQMHGIMFITADHGNAEDKFDEKSGQPRTAHTANPVPFLMLDETKRDRSEKLPLKELADIKDFILKSMDIM